MLQTDAAQQEQSSDSTVIEGVAENLHVRVEVCQA